MDLELICDCLAPVEILRCLRTVGIPAVRRPMRRGNQGPGSGSGADQIAGRCADFAILLDGRPLVGLRRLRQDDALLEILRSEEATDRGLYGQLEGLRRFPLPLVVLESRLSRKFSRWEPATYSLQYWCFRNHLFVFHTPDTGGTAVLLEVLFRKMQLLLHEAGTSKKAFAAGRI